MIRSAIRKGLLISLNSTCFRDREETQEILFQIIFHLFSCSGFSESREQCCAHQKEIENLRLLVLKLNRRLYFAEAGVPPSSNGDFVELASLPRWVKNPEETCMLLERNEKQLGEQAILLNEYEVSWRFCPRKTTRSYVINPPGQFTLSSNSPCKIFHWIFWSRVAFARYILCYDWRVFSLSLFFLLPSSTRWRHFVISWRISRTRRNVWLNNWLESGSSCIEKPQVTDWRTLCASLALIWAHCELTVRTMCIDSPNFCDRYFR